ncbi:MAG: hypothetical protein AABY27_00105 [Pseudomonadota bacterium]
MTQDRNSVLKAIKKILPKSAQNMVDTIKIEIEDALNINQNPFKQSPEEKEARDQYVQRLAKQHNSRHGR